MRTQEKPEFIGQVQLAVSNIISAMQTVKGLSSEYTALSLGTEIADADFSSIPSAAGITAAEFKDAVTSLAAIDTFLTSNGHYPKLYKVKKLQG